MHIVLSFCKTMKLKNYIFFVALVWSSLLYSQKAPILIGASASYNYTGRITDKKQLNSSVLATIPLAYIFRGETKIDPNLYIANIEQALNYRASQRFFIGGGYTLQLYRVSQGFRVWDKRLFLQATLLDSSKKSEFQHRLRYEKRNISVWYYIPIGINHRLRYRFMVSTPIDKNKYLTINAEPYLSLSKNIPTRFNELWWYIGFGKKTKPNQRFEFGLQSINWRFSKNSWQKQYYFSIGWFRALKGDN